MGKNGVDGVYTDDPRQNPEAVKLDEVSYEKALRDGLKVVDAAAFSLCSENKLKMRVFGMSQPGNVTKALLGDEIGTVLYSEK